MKPLAKCFYDIFDRSVPHTVMDAGLRVIEVRRITGTLDKCGELDADFRYIKRRDRGERSRMHRLREAAKSYLYIPPIDAVFYRGEYYVIDGNRRVAVAKALGVEYIDANVKEYALRDDTESSRGALSRRRFESLTGLKNINLFRETGYEALLEELSLGEEVSLRSGAVGAGKRGLRSPARKWYTELFIPAVSEIAESELPKLYPGLTPGDIFVLILRFYREFFGGLPEDVSFETAVSGYLFAHALPQRRPWRILPFRILQTLIMGRSDKEDFSTMKR
jgi:hypothetical protein